MSNRPPASVSLKKRQRYILDETDDIYEERVQTYREILEDKHPNFFDWDLHCVMLRNHVAAEMEFEKLDRKVQNDIEVNLFDVKNRDKAFDRMKWGYEKLGFPVEVIKRLKQTLTGAVEAPKSFDEEVEVLLARMDEPEEDMDLTQYE